VGVLWTYDGWGNLNIVAGEVAGAGRSVARALLATVAVVTGIYLLLNVTYLVLLPLDVLTNLKRISSHISQLVFPILEEDS